MKASPQIDSAVRAAQSLPDLVTKLELVDPSLAARVAGQVQVPWGRLLVGAVTYASAKWGLGWDQTVDEVVAAGALVVGGYVVSWGRSAFAALAQRVSKAPTVKPS